MAKTIHWIKPLEAGARAAEIGFPRAVLDPTVEVWLAGMNSGTDLHADNYAGTIAWHEAIKTIRLYGLEHGLEKLVRDGVQLCYCARTRVAVMIAQGDARTGDVEHLALKPSTKYPRGPMSCAVLRAQLSLFVEDAGPIEDYEVWILLVHMDATGEIRAELSWPSLITTRMSKDGEESGTIVDWHERIFLGSIEAGPQRLRRMDAADLAPAGAVDVPLKKRD